MDVLPVEILDLIVDHCDFRSLKQLRSVNCLFQKLCTSRVFEHVHMAFFQDSFEKFSSLAKSSLAEHVKRFTLLTDILPEWGREQWERSISLDAEAVPRNGLDYILAHQRMRAAHQAAEESFNIVGARERWRKQFEAYESNSGCLTNAELDAGWDAFKQLRREQWEWSQEHHGVAFKEMFALLPNLIAAEALALVPFLGHAHEMDVWARGEQRVQGLSAADFIINSDYRNSPKRRKRSGRRVLCLLEAIGFRSSFAGTSQITQLALHTVHRETLRDLTLAPSQSAVEPLTLQQSTRFHLMEDAFRDLTEIHLNVPHAIDCWRPGQKQSSTELCALLSSAHDLQKLTLLCKERKTEALVPPTQYHLLKLLAQTPHLWPRLEHLSLCIDTPSGVLLTVFEVLAPSLRTLELRDMLVEDVPQLLQQIPKILNLEHIYVQSIWHGSHHDIEFELAEPYMCVLPFGTDVKEAQDVGEERARDLKEYLLRKADEMPDLSHLGDVWVRRD